MTVTDIRPGAGRDERVVSADSAVIGRVRRPAGNSGRDYLVTASRVSLRLPHAVRLRVLSGGRYLDSATAAFRPEHAQQLGTELIEYASLAAAPEGREARGYYPAESGRHYGVELLTAERDGMAPRQRRVRLVVRSRSERGGVLATVTDVFRVEDALALGVALIANAGRATCDCPEDIW